jgi:hypothetical protein
MLKRMSQNQGKGNDTKQNLEKKKKKKPPPLMM